MDPIKKLSPEQATTLLAFIAGVEDSTTGAWSAIAEHMREEWGIVDPEAALEDASKALE
ncbi:MAG: hypothetical protein AAGI34_09840 [Pseudomonadota bacterium]